MIDSGVSAPVPVRADPDPVELVRGQVRARPEREALVELAAGRRTTLTYGELGRRVDDLAARLAALPVAPGEPVAVLVASSLDATVAMLAVLSAGAAYCPLDRGAPPRRTATVLAALRPRAAIVDAAHADRLPAGVPLLDVAGPSSSGPVEPAPFDPGATAYVLFTSGSTGAPKGVAMDRAGLARLIAWQAADGPPGLRTLRFTATTFDVVFQEVLSTLATGGCLVAVAEEVRRDPATLLETIDAERVERLFLPYVALQLLADAARRRGAAPRSLRHVVTAGERLVITPAIRALFTALPGCRLDNHYGPTEAHLVTSHTLPADPATWPVAPAIGAPVGGVTCLLLDERLQPVPDGATGELYVAGTGLARGYVHEPARTAERFVAHAGGRRIYRTGDLARRVTGAGGEASFEFVGRADGQLKVRGFRVEPAEVEHALLEHPRVVAAAVGLRELTADVPALVAYLQTDGPTSHREIVDHVRDVLPPYMVPARTVVLEMLPRTASGKVDAAALAAVELPEAAEEAVAQAAAQAAALPDVIATVWTRVLGHDEFTHDDDFFDVGGDSLLATWVVAELGQALGHPVELSLLLEYSTVEDLAVALSSVEAGGGAAATTASQIMTLRPGPSGRVLYLLHPLGGELIGYRELARASQAPMRLLGVGWSGPAPAVGTPLAEIAAVHVAQIRTVQPDGPYLLAGWSFGGVLAYEVAQQLVADGAPVAFLGMLDANPVLDPITGLPLGETAFLELLDAVAARLDEPGSGDLAELTTSTTWVQLMGAPITGGASPAYLRGAVATARACMRAAMDYRPRPYPGRVHLYQAAAAGHRERVAAALVDLVAGPVTTAVVPGDHWGLMRAGAVERLAELVDQALESAAETGSGT